MTPEEIAKIICEHTYSGQCNAHEKAAGTMFTFDEYWERNKKYFIDRAKIYLEVKECLEKE